MSPHQRLAADFHRSSGAATSNESPRDSPRFDSPRNGADSAYGGGAVTDFGRRGLVSRGGVPLGDDHNYDYEHDDDDGPSSSRHSDIRPRGNNARQHHASGLEDGVVPLNRRQSSTFLPSPHAHAGYTAQRGYRWTRLQMATHLCKASA